MGISLTAAPLGGTRADETVFCHPCSDWQKPKQMHPCAVDCGRVLDADVCSGPGADFFLRFCTPHTSSPPLRRQKGTIRSRLDIKSKQKHHSVNESSSFDPFCFVMFPDFAQLLLPPAKRKHPRQNLPLLLSSSRWLHIHYTIDSYISKIPYIITPCV